MKIKKNVFVRFRFVACILLAGNGSNVERLDNKSKLKTTELHAAVEEKLWQKTQHAADGVTHIVHRGQEERDEETYHANGELSEH